MDVKNQLVNRFTLSSAVAKLALIPKNKFYTGKLDGQHSDYLVNVIFAFPDSGCTTLLIFLTLAKEEALEESYLMLGYEDVKKIIERYPKFN